MILQDCQPARILVVDDDPVVSSTVASLLKIVGHAPTTANSGRDALNLLREARGPLQFRLLISDLHMPQGDGLEVLRQVRKHYPSVVVMIVTGYATVQTAVEAIRLGAVDYLNKPVPAEEFKEAVTRALRHQSLAAENLRGRSPHHGVGGGEGLDRLIGNDRRMQRIHELAQAVAPTKTTVLINGESGTGKSMVARVVHELSPRRNGPLVTCSCGSIPETLLESELFGHVRGAFTGAEADKPGRVRAAEGGTLFIDEINSATPAFQVKLLRVLQEKTYEPVGSHQTVLADVRFVLATNEPLDRLVKAGRFREDLYYRINVVTIDIPPLRDRNGDVVALAQHFLEKHCEATGKLVTGVTPEAMEVLMRYRWPGNVRELENAIERAVVLARRPVITADDLPESLRTQGPNGDPNFIERRRSPWGLPANWVPVPLRQAMEAPEKQVLLMALKHRHWNRQLTAADLDIDRTTLYKKIKHYGLDEAVQ